MGSSTLENPSKNPYLTWPTAVKTFEKHENAPTRTQKNNQILLRRLLDEYTELPTPPSPPPRTTFTVLISTVVCPTAFNT